MDLSVVIPVFNEEANISTLLVRLDNILDEIQLSSEIIVVDDGSRDKTFAKLSSILETMPRLSVIQLRRNFGQHAATYAGFDLAKGSKIITLDGDFQNDPADIPKLLEELEKGYDIICGWRKDRKDSFLTRRLPSLIVNKLIRSNAPSPVHDYGCFLRAYQAESAKELAYYGTSHGWFPVLFSRLGYKVGEIEVRHYQRPKRETSKHSFFVRLDQFMSVFMGTAFRPFQFVEVLGFVAMATGFIAAIIGMILALFLKVFSFLFICAAGIAFSMWGFAILIPALVGEYLIRINYEIGKQPKYLVKGVFPSSARDNK